MRGDGSGRPGGFKWQHVACGLPEAARYAARLGLRTIGASDCHVPEKVGVCATWFPEEVRTLDEFIKVFQRGGLKPACWSEGQYKILQMREYESPRKVNIA